MLPTANGHLLVRLLPFLREFQNLKQFNFQGLHRFKLLAFQLCVDTYP